MKKVNIVVLIVITTSIFLFFNKLFFPHLSLIVSPDFGENDLLHGYYPIKFLLSQVLHSNQFPIWTNLTASGYPIFADGQIGSLSLINLILFKFLPFALAINIGYILIFFLAGLGTYLFCREIKIGIWPSLLAGVIFSLSGFNIGQITHISLLQASSFMPLEFYFVERILKKGKLFDILMLSIILSQQIFSGHQQMTVYSLISLTAYVFVRYIFLRPNIKTKDNKINRNIIFILVGVMFGILMSLALLIPSYELFKQSGARNNIDILSQFPYPLNNLLTFINPFYFGNPAIGSYPVYNSNWGIFWENNGYVGLIPIICLLLSLFFIKKTEIKIWLCLLVFSILMILGRNSPLYLLYNFPPLSFFRVPSRFLILTDFSMAIISAIVIQSLLFRLKKKTIILFLFGTLLVSIQVFNIFYYFYDYHAVENAADLFSMPETIKYLNSQKDKGRLFTIDDAEAWNKIFLTSGWKDIKAYDKFKSGVFGHSNLYYDYAKWSSVQFPTKRMSIVNQLYSISLEDETKNTYLLATGSAKLMGSNNITFILAPKSMSFINIPLEKKFKNYDIYRNPYSASRFRMVYQAKEVTTIQDLINYADSPEFNPKETVILEDLNISERLKRISGKKPYGKIDVITNTDRDLVFKIKTDQPGFFIISDTYYPGWKAYIDGKESKIYPANISQRSVFVDKGDHIIKFIYDPLSIKIGFAISTICYLLIIALLVNQFFKRLV